MQTPPINRATGIAVPTQTTATSTQAAELQQRSEQPSQRASHSLRSIGRRMAKGVGKLFQKNRSPRQNVTPTPPGSTSNRPPDGRLTTSGSRGTASPDAATMRARSDGSSGSGDPSTQEAHHTSAAPPSGLTRSNAGRFDRQSGNLERLRQEQSSNTPRPSVRRPGVNESRSSPSASSDASAARPSGLTRSNAGRFDEQLTNLESDTPEQPSITLNANGKPDFSTFSTPGMAPLLDTILGKPEQHYLAVHSPPGDQDHLLLESSGHLLNLTQNTVSLAVIRSSQQTPAADTDRHADVNLEANAGRALVNVNGNNATLELPGKAHIAHITGVHCDPNGEQLRVHEDRLYHFDTASLRWNIPEGNEENAFNSLTTGGNGLIYAKSDDVVVDLSSNEMPHLQVDDLQSFSVAPDSTVACLSGTDTQTLLIADMSPGTGGPRHQKTLKLDDGNAQAASVGLSADHLFIADTQGRLYSTPRTALEGDDPQLSLEPERARYQRQGQTLGGHHSVTGFISANDGRVHALVKNRQGEVHSHALDPQRSQMESGWNLTEALALDNTTGLPTVAAPEAAGRLNLDRSGLVGISAGRLQRWDATPQCWKDAGIKDVEQLQRGADSNAYALKGGKLHTLKVSPEHPNVAFGPHTSLAQTARSTKVELGKEIEGLEGRVITAFAMVSEKRFVALDDQNRLTAHRKDGKPSNLALEGLQGEIKTLSLDEKHNLYALTDTGGLFCMPRQSWQSTRLADVMNAKWTPVSTPNGQPIKALFSNDDNVLSAQVEDAADQGLMRLKGGQWQPFTQRPVEENGLNDTHQRIKRAHTTWRLPFSGLTAKVDVNTGGRGGMEKSHRAPTREFIRANIWKNTLEVPRWMKVAGYHIQHRYRGREGLAELYSRESIVFKQLELIHESAGTPPLAGRDLKSRIERLTTLGPAGEPFVKALEALRDELEQHSHTALIAIGQSYGSVKNLRQQDGVLNQHGELAKASSRMQLGKKLAQLGEAFNFKSSGHDLVKELDDALAIIAPSPDCPTAELLKKLKDNGVKISHQKIDIPLGRRRDAGEDQGLSKARLALDLVTLHELGRLLDQAELLTPQNDLSVLEKKLTALRDKTYGENPIKLVTDMGFTDNGALETSYDSVKTFLKVFKKPDHAVSVNMRAATGSKDQSELADKFKSMLKQLEHGDDEIGLTRSYGGNLTSPLTVLSDMGTGPWPTAGATGNRNYILNAERTEGGITLYLLSEAAGNVSGGVGAGKDYWPVLVDENNPARSVNIGNNRRMTPNFRLGGELVATAAGSQRSGVVFNVADENIDEFVDDLFEGALNPLQVMKKAVDHETYQARRFNFDITAGGTADMRIGFGLSVQDSKPLSAVARLGVAANVTINLLSYTDYSLTQKNDKTELREGGKNRPRWFNSFLAGIQGRAQLSGTHTDATSTPASAPGPTPGTQSAANNVGANVTVSVERRTVKRVKFRYNVATPMTAKSLDKLSTSLGAAFNDKATKTRLAELARLTTPTPGTNPEEAVQTRLTELKTFFDTYRSQNDKQYKALRDLKRAVVQHQASLKKHSVLDNARFETSKTDLSGLDSESILTKIMSSIRDASAPGNAARVADFMRKDPKLRAMLNAMQASDGTLARVRLEPKDSMIDRIDEGSLKGDMTQKELSGLLEDRNQMRIKRLVVFHTATQAENFTLPSPLASYNSGTSLNITKVLGRINFVYGEDQDTPIGYTFDGELSRPSESLKEAADLLKKQGFELKT
ncbi:AvrE-family type 3 secretion system effector [Pseudomonas viridiflava]|uniref:AvrE-family type 3 secretion system effector n=2 Tax=Pseudomonas viridiflava TaxID=33069 RepID=UPI0015E3CCF0|nr:AvrE-family type 3 secretion system effector [Pseudomonas viridiflava]